MSSVYYIKIYYTKPNQKQEIRRFSIDISPENDVFNELKTTITTLLTDEKLSNFTLQYADEDDERITFSTNDELRSAITLHKEANTLKVFVTFNQSTLEQKSEETPASTNKDVHTGVQCDNCQNPVIGFRYKCFVCPNYDLCESCSAAGVHSEHNMIKITKPGTFYLPNNHFYPHYQHQQYHMPPPGSYPPPPPAPHSTFTTDQDYLGKIQAQMPNWMPHRERAQHVRAHIQEHLNSLKTTTQARMQNSKQYLESVGQYLQQILTPYGIECEYHVDEQKSNTNQGTENEVPDARQEHAEPNAAQLANNNSTNQEQIIQSNVSLSEESTPIINPIEQSINECLEKLVSMGFVDTDGSLRNLIRAKQGDINSILDALNRFGL